MAITLTTVKARSGGELLKLVSPYHPDLVPEARRLNGRWDGDRKAWYFDPRDAEALRAVVARVYGIDPLAPPATDELVNVRVRLSGSAYYGASVFLLGRELASRPSRDSRVRLGQGVVVLEGEFPESGGSVKHPDLWSRHGSSGDVLLEVRDVPRAVAEQALAGDPSVLSFSQEVVPSGPPPAAEQILALAAQLTPEQRAVIAERILALGPGR